jgi:prepilin-type N-terminal cleavage/methylation domain-containing protein
MTARVVRIVARARGERGFTLVELIGVLAILSIVLGALITLFVSGAEAELDLNDRFQAQQEARLAADRLRRDVHCASGVTLAGATVITVGLSTECPSSGGADTVVYTTQFVAPNRYRLLRTGTPIADYLTTDNLFSCVPATASSTSRLRIELNVNVKPSEGWKRWRLVDEIALRNPPAACIS